jgi:hypothetical protein
MASLCRVCPAILFFSLALATNEAAADAFRCGSYVVREGMMPGDIEERCGKPDLVKTTEEPVYSRLDNGATVQVGTAITIYWYYDRGPNQYVAKIIIRDSIAEEIDLLDITDIEDLKDE